MEAGQLVPFLAVSALVIVTPGQDTLLTVKNTLGGGRRSGVLTAAGVSAGQAVWTVLAAAGLTALLVASETAFLALRLVGAAYLVLLGLQALAAACRRRAGPLPTRSGRVAPRSAFLQGMLSNLANPKMAVFFTSLLPQFAPDDGAASFATLLALGLAFCTMTLAWLATYAVAVSRAGELFRRSRVRRALEAATGAVLVALGLRIAAEAR